MSKPLTIQLPDELDEQLTLQAQKLNISREELILRSLADTLNAIDEDNEPKELILNSLRISLQEIKEGVVYPIEELWEGIDV